MLWLVKNGVPWDIATELDELNRFVWSVIFRELEGAEFDIDQMRFKEQRA